MVRSALIIAEGHGWFLRATISGFTIQGFDEVPNSRKSSRLLKKFHDRDLTLADAHGLAIMAERRTVSCWPTDRPFRLSGVPRPI